MGRQRRLALQRTYGNSGKPKTRRKYPYHPVLINIPFHEKLFLLLFFYISFVAGFPELPDLRFQIKPQQQKNT